MPSTIQSDKDTAANEAKPLPHGVYIHLENTANKQCCGEAKAEGRGLG